MAYLVYHLTSLAIYLMIAFSYAIPVGYTGVLHLGQIGLLAVGTYTAAILTTRGVPFVLALAAAAVVTGAVGFILALPSRRVKGDYYALVTLGFLFVVGAVIVNGGTLTGGTFGISGISRPAGFDQPVPFLMITLSALALIAGFVYRLVRSPLGRALEAVRDDDGVAESLGKPTAKLRLVSLTVSAVIVGIAGAYLAHFIQFINAQVFWLDNAVWILAALAVGGLASFWGAAAGTVALYVISETIRFLPISVSLVGPLRLIAYALILLLVIRFFPKGLMGRAQLD